MRSLLVLHCLLWAIDSQVINDTVPRNAGIYFRLNQKAVDYMSELASDSFPLLLNKLSPPDVKMSRARVYNTLIHEVTRPNITAKFVDQKGVRANILFPYIRISSRATISVFFEYDGGFLADIHNLTIGMEVHYTRNETSKRNVITSPYCEVNNSHIAFIFEKNSEISGMKDEIGIKMIEGLRDAVCVTALEALQYIDDQQVQPVMPDPALAEVVVPSDGSEFSAAELGYNLCQAEVEHSLSTTTTTTVLPPLDDDVTNSSSASWGVDLTLVYPPRFSSDDVVFGMDGGILLNSESARDVDPPSSLDTSALSEKMVGILLSEYIPNTLFSHIYDSGLGAIHERLTPDDMPKSIRKPIRMLCAACYLDIVAHLTDKPFVHIDKELGARVRLSANVTIQFMGRTELHDLIHATATLHVTLKPTIRHSRIYGDVSLTNVDVNVHDLGVGGALAGPIEKLVGLVVPRVLWPQVKKRLRFALNRRGIQLPVLCGVELEHLSLSYIDRAVVVNTDFNFDLPLFVRKFKNYLRYKSTINDALPRYID